MLGKNNLNTSPPPTPATYTNKKMFLLWSKATYDGKYLLFAKESLDEIRQDYFDFCEENFGDESDPQTELIEKKLEAFSVYSCDWTFYVTHLANVNANKPIFVFMFTEDGEGASCHNEISFHLSNDREEMLAVARDYFETESRDTEEADVRAMIDSLNTCGEYCIPHGRTYVCEMKLSEFRPYVVPTWCKGVSGKVHG